VKEVGVLAEGEVGVTAEVAEEIEEADGKGVVQGVVEEDTLLFDFDFCFASDLFSSALFLFVL
jgi:hypothetical protein